MKKSISALFILCLVCTMITGCAKKEGNAKSQSVAAQGKAVDVDLSALSSTMAYAEVSNIMKKPKDYVGKIIKINGPYFVVNDDEKNVCYHYVIVEDVTACCMSGMEFIWKGDHEYPKDYPNENEKIEVTGVFESYDELGYTYFYLSVDEISVL